MKMFTMDRMECNHLMQQLPIFVLIAVVVVVENLNLSSPLRHFSVFAKRAFEFGVLFAARFTHFRQIEQRADSCERRILRF